MTSKEIEERLNVIEANLDKLIAKLTPEEIQEMEAYIKNNSKRKGT